MMPPSLEELDLSGDWNTPHKFTGGTPPEWGSLTNLKKLSMAYCGLDGASSRLDQFDTENHVHAQAPSRSPSAALPT